MSKSLCFTQTVNQIFSIVIDYTNYIPRMEDKANTSAVQHSQPSQQQQKPQKAITKPYLNHKSQSLDVSSRKFRLKKDLNRQSGLLPSNMIQQRRTQTLKQLCVISILKFAAKRLDQDPNFTKLLRQLNQKKSTSVVGMLRQISLGNSLKADSKILICSTKIRKKRQEADQCRCLLNLAHVIYKNKKRQFTERKNRALQSFEVVLNSKVQQLKIDMKSLRIQDLQCGLDPLSLLNSNICIRQKQDTKKQLFEIAYINKDIKQMTLKNPEYEYMVIQQIVNIIKNKTMNVRNGTNQLQKNIGQLSYRDFREFYEELKKINLYLVDILSILSKYLSIEQNKTLHDFGQPVNRTGFAIKTRYENYYEIVSISLKNIIQAFNRHQTDLVNISSSIQQQAIQYSEMTNQNFKKFLSSASRLRYHLVYINKEIVFLNGKLSSNNRQEKLSKTTSGSVGFHSSRNVLSTKYFFNKIDTQENQKQQTLARKILFSKHEHKIADNRIQIKRRMYNDPSNSQSVSICLCR